MQYVGYVFGLFLIFRKFYSHEQAFNLYRSTTCFILTNIGTLFCLFNYVDYSRQSHLLTESYMVDSKLLVMNYNWNHTQNIL